MICLESTNEKEGWKFLNSALVHILYMAFQLVDTTSITSFMKLLTMRQPH